VLELIQAFEQVTGKPINYQVTARRPGDIAECYADPCLAKQQLGWVAEKTLHDMVADSWHWQQNNPQGFE
jgi:UDP-glucose 4-epimerase